MTDFTCGDTCAMSTPGTNNYYVENNVCIECVQDNCAECSNAAACTQCNVGFHLEEDANLGTPGECVEDCGDHQYETWPLG